MKPSNELIAKYLKRECTPEEAEQVYVFFKSNPSEFEKYFDEMEWQTLHLYKNPEPARSDQMLKNILSQVESKPEKEVFRINRKAWSSLAACMCLFMTYLLWQHVTTHTVIKPVNVAVSVKSLQWKAVKNNRNQVLSIRLDDGSKVDLKPGSSVRYTVPFKRQLRDIYLSGEAKFFVAKDKQRAFTVYAGPLATTALGTVFNITAWAASSRTKVRLLSGKVKVVQYHHANPDAQAVYLLPGKELIFNNLKQSLFVSAFSNGEAKTLAAVQPGTTVIRGDTINFINQQLPQVISKLQDAYHVRIASALNLRNYYFTGQFNSRTDAVDNVLGTITMLNKLGFTLQPDSTYTIIKPAIRPQTQPKNKL